MFAKYAKYMGIPHSPTPSDYDDRGAGEGFRIVLSDKAFRRKDEVVDSPASSISMQEEDGVINWEELRISSRGPHEEDSDLRSGGRLTCESRNGL